MSPTLDGSGTALVAITKVLITRTGTDQEIAYNLLDHAFLPKMTMLWILQLSSTKQPMTKNTKNTAR